MKRSITYLIPFLIFNAANLLASDPAEVFLDALTKGDSIAPMLETPETTPVIKALKQSTGNQGDIMIHARLIKRFVQQKHCGRIDFRVEQPSSNHSWPQIGGQFNICEDGLPPWRICPNHPDVLIPPTSQCSDGSQPQDTQEVRSAIAESIKNGSLTREQVKAILLKQKSAEISK